MKYIILLVSLLIMSNVHALSYSVNPSTGVFTQTSAEPDVDLSVDNVQSLYFGLTEQVILVSTTSKAWLNIEKQWYVLPSNVTFNLVFNEEMVPQIPAGATLSAGPYGAEPILKYEVLNYDEVIGSHYRLIIVGGKYHIQRLPHYGCSPDPANLAKCTCNNASGVAKNCYVSSGKNKYPSATGQNICSTPCVLK